jgi:hypothetical protein
VGISITEYNEMTPYELNLHILDFYEKQKQEREDKLTLTYLGAYWQRVEKLSIQHLKKVLDRDKPKKEMTNQEMLNEVKKLNAAFGGTTY